MENLFKLLFPTGCLFCSKAGVDFCSVCKAKCKELSEQRCIVCDTPAGAGLTHVACLPGAPVSLFAAFEYAGIVRDCIKKAKYSSREFIALKELADMGTSVFCKYVNNCGTLSDLFNDVESRILVIPAPISVQKMKIRGFNQAEIIARSLYKKCTSEFYASFVYAPKLVIRHKDTVAQHNFSREDRFKNVIDAFRADHKHLRGCVVLLVDDITTTGATLLELSKELYNKGADKVMCFALSKKLLDRV